MGRRTEQRTCHEDAMTAIGFSPDFARHARHACWHTTTPESGVYDGVSMADPPPRRLPPRPNPSRPRIIAPPAALPLGRAEPDEPESTPEPPRSKDGHL